MSSSSPTPAGTFDGGSPRKALRMDPTPPAPRLAGCPRRVLYINGTAATPRGPPPSPNQTGETAPGRGVRRTRSPTCVLPAYDSDTPLEDYRLPNPFGAEDEPFNGSASSPLSWSDKPSVGEDDEKEAAGDDTDPAGEDVDADINAAIQESRRTVQIEEARRAAVAANRQMNEDVTEWLEAGAPAVTVNTDKDDDTRLAKPRDKPAAMTYKGKEVIVISSDEEDD
jgi:hypothetical protein